MISLTDVVGAISILYSVYDGYTTYIAGRFVSVNRCGTVSKHGGEDEWYVLKDNNRGTRAAKIEVSKSSGVARIHRIDGVVLHATLLWWR